jgi:hypothetical protein
VVRVIEDGDSRALPLRLDIERRSPTGFEVGYGGSGPAQLAIAILADATGSAQIARLYHQRFKWKVTAQLPRNGNWQLTHFQVLQVLGSLMLKLGEDNQHDKTQRTSDRSA